eukprot:PLAT5141.1.p1 GENE.PLAT5141.1~~PLAT5141.1.p1  ORF type:complete len:551 (+),score=234.87 PLAT5141.1:337-1989(+)
MDNNEKRKTDWSSTNAVSTLAEMAETASPPADLPPSPTPSAASEVYLQQQVKYLDDQGNWLIRKIEIEKRALAETTRKVDAARARLMAAKKAVAEMSTTSKPTDRGRLIKVMENKVEKETVRLNELRDEQTRLRGAINVARQDRVKLLTACERLEKSILKSESQTESLMSDYETLLAEQEALRAELDSVEKAGQAAKLGDEAAMRALDDEYRHRAVRRLAVRRSSRTDAMRATLRRDEAVGGMTPKEEKTLAHASHRAHWMLAKARVDLDSATSKASQYNDALRRIREGTGVHDVDELVEAFAEAERRSYSAYTQLTTLQEELESVRDMGRIMEETVSKFRVEGEEGSAKRERIRESCEEELARLAEAETSYESKVKALEGMLGSLKEPLFSIFLKVGCDDPLINEKLRADGVTDGNIMQFLGVVEQRVCELSQLSLHAGLGPSFSPVRRARGGEEESEEDRGSPTRVGRLHVPLPSADDMVDSEEDDSDATDDSTVRIPLDPDAVRKQYLAGTAKLPVLPSVTYPGRYHTSDPAPRRRASRESRHLPAL